MKSKLTYQEEGSEQEAHEAAGLSRRGFMVTTSLAAAGVGAAGLMRPSPAEAAPKPGMKNYGLGPYPVEGMAVYSADGPHKRMSFQRRALGPKDVAIQLQYCGVCHSDIHHGREHWRKETGTVATTS